MDLKLKLRIVTKPEGPEKPPVDLTATNLDKFFKVYSIAQKMWMCHHVGVITRQDPFCHAHYCLTVAGC